MKFEELKGIIEDADFEVNPYSRRSTCGKICLSFTVDSPSNEIHTIVRIVREAVWQGWKYKKLDELLEILNEVTVNSMGRGTVFYFPQIEWGNSVAEE